MTGRKEPQGEPIKVQAEEGNVAFAAPGGVVVVLSPDAAEETSDQLWKGAMVARRQQLQSDRSRKRRKKNSGQLSLL